MRALRERRKAAGLKEVVQWVRTEPKSHGVYSSHRLLEIRSLAMHALIAAKIDRNQELLSIAHRNLNRWESRWAEDSPRWIAEWRAILRKPWKEIAMTLVEMTENASRLRQSSPFAGVLTAIERRRVYEALRP